jgi:L-threonylcarbamoyladenylate synthase
MPLHQVALDLLKRTGPLAVSSANVSGRPAATTADEAMAQLGDSVAVYLDGGPCADDVPSTIVDLTGSVPRLLRQGVITVERLREVIPLALEDEALDDEAAEDELSGDEIPRDELSEHAIPEDGITGDEDSQETGKAAPAGPAESARADAGEPGVVSHGAEDAADQGNHADRDVTG